MTARHRTHSTLPLALALLALPGCDAADPELAAELELRTLDADMLADEAICPSDRRIVKRSQGDCANIGAWTGTSLFPGAPVGELRGLCSYEWTGDDETPLLGELTANVDSHAPDCVSVLEHTNDALETELGEPLRELFFDGVNAPRATDLNPKVTQTPVKVVVVDTSPSAGGVTPRSPHGEAMVDIIEALACPLSTCSVTVERMLALPRVVGGTLDTTRGGYIGSHGDLAKAIYAAANLTGSRKVMNLSLGWEPGEFGDVGESVAVDAVYAALEYAACKGVLVVAAAGNQGYSAETGPILPGGWEMHSAPTQARCSQLGVTVGPQVSRPLVYSVGGVRYGIEPLPGTREDGFPRLAASAMHVTVDDESPTLSGTSVSAATVAGAAALLWSYKHTLSVPQVMEHLYAGGKDLQRTADYVHTSYTQTMSRRVDVCDALLHALGSATPHPLDCRSLDPLLADASEIESINDVLLAGKVPMRPGLVVTNCGGFDMYAPSGSSCPDEDGPSTPYVLPQPTQPACPNCTLKKSDAVVLASLDPEYYDVLEWTVANVEVVLTDGTARTLYRLDGSALNSTTITELWLDSMPTHAVTSATISITFQEFPRAQVNQLLVLD